MKGWEPIKIGDVLKLEYGKPLPKEKRDEAGAYVAYGANGVFCRTNEYYWDKPSIIVGRKGSAGEINLSEDRFWPLDVTYFVVFDDQKYDLKFLYYCLSVLNITGLAKGVKPGINRNDVYALESVFPPLPEQKRIVAILDEAFAGIDAAFANTEKNLANARDLFESYLNGVFTRKGDGWVEKKLGDICNIGDGNYSSKYPKASEFLSTGVPFLTATNLKNGTILPDGIRYISKEQHAKLTKGHTKEGDLVIVVRGSSTGNNSIVPEAFAGSNLNSQLALLRLNTPDILSKFLFISFNSPYTQKQVKSSISGAAQPQLPNNKLLDIKVLYPPQSMQKKIVDKSDSVSYETERLETIYQQKLTALAELKQSILQKAFSGELTADAALGAKKAVA